MARARTLTRSHLLKGLVALSVLSCFTSPRGADRPRQLLAPLLAPIGQAGTYVSDAVGRNLNDLLAGDCDDQTARDLLADPRLRRRLHEAMVQKLQRQVAAYERLVAQQRLQLAELTAARQALGEDFPCKLVPATVIAADAGPYGRARLVRIARRPPPGSAVTTRDVLTNRPTAIPEAVAALSGSALVGRVDSSGAWTAHVQLISDPDYRTRGLVSRLLYPGRPRQITAEQQTSDGRTLFVQRPLAADDPAIPVNLVGNGTGMTSAALPAHHGVEPGDLVVTAGDDDRLPMSIVIGAVETVEPLTDNPKHVRVTVAPAVDLDALRRVYVVLPMATRGR